MKKIWLKALGIVLLLPPLLFTGAIALVYAKQEAIVQKALETVNERFQGALYIETSRIAPFANFPYISVDLKGIQFFEDKSRNALPLYSIQDLYLGFDITDLAKGNYRVKTLKITGAQADIVRDSSGQINILKAKNLYDIEEDTSAAKPIDFDIKTIKLAEIDLKINDQSAGIRYESTISKLKAGIKNLNNHLFLDISTDLLLGIFMDDKPEFFHDKHITLGATLDYHQDSGLLNIVQGKASLGAAYFDVAGTVNVQDDMDMDLQISGDKPDFNTFAAFMPPAIEAAFQTYQNAGKIFFDGHIKGKATNGHTPAIQVDFGCEDTYILNKKAKKRVRDLRFKGSYTNGKDRSLASSVLQINNFYAKPEQGVFEGRLLIRNFLDPYIKVNLHADLDLDFIGKFFELEGLRRIRGNILLDMDFDEIIDLRFPGENLAQLKKGIDSELRLKDLYFALPGYPHPIEKLNGRAVMEEGAITLDSLSMRIGASDLRIAGKLNDFPALWHKQDKPLSIQLSAQAAKIDLPDLLSYDTALARRFDEVVRDFQLDLHFETQAQELYQFKYLPKGEFFIDDLYAKLEHYPHALHDFHADLLIRDSDIQLIDFSGEIDSSDFHFSGTLENYPKWFQESPRGDSRFLFDLKSNYLKINDLLTYKGENYLPEEYRKESFRELDLKGKLDLHYQGSFQSADLYLDRLYARTLFHPMKLEQFKGRVHYEDEQLTVDNFSGKMGKSDFFADLSWYMGKDPKKKKRPNSLYFKSKVLDLDALSSYQGPEQQTNHETAFNLFELPFADIRIVADIGKMNYHRYWLENIHTELRIQQNHYIHVDTLAMRLADGAMQMKGYFNGSDPKNIYFKSKLWAQHLDLDKLMFKFDNFGQDQLINENLHGKISGLIESTFRMHPDLTPIVQNSEAHMELTITEGSLVKFTPMLAMSDYFSDKNLNLVRFDTLQNTLDLKDGVLHIPNMNINSSLGFLELSGRQKMDTSMDYFVRIPLKLVTQVGWRALFGSKKREEIDPDQMDEIYYRDGDKKVLFVNVRITGTGDDFKVTLSKEKNKRR